METITMRYRMSDQDIFYGGGIVPGSRNITLMEDCSKRLMAKVVGNTGKITKVKKIRLYAPIKAGDYMEYKARIKRIEGTKALIEVRAFKIIEVPENPPFPSSIDVLAESILCTVVQYVLDI